MSGACGTPIAPSDAAVFTSKFTQGEVKHDSKGRDQILMFMCSPYGYYEVEIEIFGGKEGATGAVHWEVELGPSQVRAPIFESRILQHYKLTSKYRSMGYAPPCRIFVASKIFV